jgi:transcriptional regulator with XRE-family HTH domain
MLYNECVKILSVGERFRKLDEIAEGLKGDELRLKRVSAGLKQADVAMAAGMSQSRLSNYEKGRHIPNEQSRKMVLSAIEGLRIPVAFNRMAHDLDLEVKSRRRQA